MADGTGKSKTPKIKSKGIPSSKGKPGLSPKQLAEISQAKIRAKKSIKDKNLQIETAKKYNQGEADRLSREVSQSGKEAQIATTKKGSNALDIARSVNRSGSSDLNSLANQVKKDALAKGTASKTTGGKGNRSEAAKRGWQKRKGK